MLQPGRKYSAGDAYRYGFNGKENDNEVKGVEGSQQDYGMRIYDPRLGKFLSVDPLMKKYPQLTPYQFANNMPIWGTDLDGEEVNISLPRGISIPKPILTFPKAPTIPIPVQPLPPLPPPIPIGFSMPQAPFAPNVPAFPSTPLEPLGPGRVSFDESTIDPNDASTYPTPPSSLKGNWKVTPLKPGTKGYERLKDKNATRLENEEGDVLRWHAPDKYHPKGHWDFKKGGNDGKNPWENYTPDGQKIPDGKIYGKDFNPTLMMYTDIDGANVRHVPSFLWDKYLNYKMKLNEFYKQMGDYNKKMEEYQKKVKEYEKQMKQYEKKMEKFYKNHPELIV